MSTHYNSRNLSVTVHATHGAGESPERARCVVWRPKLYPPHRYPDDPPYTLDEEYTNYHEWCKKTKLCVHCGLSVSEVMGRKPRKKRSQIEIDEAHIPEDRPPVVFIGRM